MTKITIYPKQVMNRYDSEDYAPDEISRGMHWLYAYVECARCVKVQPIPAMGGLDVTG